MNRLTNTQYIARLAFAGMMIMLIAFFLKEHHILLSTWQSALLSIGIWTTIYHL